jgi:hypothetical protein
VAVTWRAAGWLLAAGFLLLNLVAYLRARSLTRFAPSGVRTPRPEDLPWPARLRVLLLGATVSKPRDDRTPGDLGLPFSSFSVPGPAGAIRCWRIPARRPRGTVILFHGYAGTRARLLPYAAALHHAGWTCVLPGFRGCSGSGGRDTSIGWHEADDVAAVAGRVGGRPVLFGSSMGAAAVLRAVAVRGVRPRAVILESPFDALVRTVGNRFRVTGLPPRPLADLLVFWGGVRLGFPGRAHRPVEWAAAVACPALVLSRERDVRARPAEVRRVRDAIPGAAPLAVLRGAAHDDVTTAVTSQWARHTRAFLRDLPAAR